MEKQTNKLRPCYCILTFPLYFRRKQDDRYLLNFPHQCQHTTALKCVLLRFHNLGLNKSWG